MVGYEYKVIPAPAKGLKAPGVKGPEARFANALEHRMNEMAADGWEYQRADILPSEERQGLTSSQTIYRSVLVFRRAVGGASQDECAEAPLPTEQKEKPDQKDEPDQAAANTEETTEEKSNPAS